MARSVSSLIDDWRQGPDLSATLKLCQRLVRLCGKPGATSPSDHKSIDGFCAEAHHLFATSGSAEALLAVASLCVTVGSLDRAEEVLASLPPEASQDIQAKRIRNKINLHQGVRGARGAPAGAAAHLLTGITHNQGLRQSRAASSQMRAGTHPPTSAAPPPTPSSNPSAPPSSHPSSGAPRSFDPSPFANVPASTPPAYSAPPSSQPAAPPYSAPLQAAPPHYAAPPQYSAPPPQTAPPPYIAPPSAQPAAPADYGAAPEENESATKAHQYSPQELLALVTREANQQAALASASAQEPPTEDDGADADPRTRGFDFSQGLPDEAFRPDQAGPHEARTLARESPLDDPDGPTRGRDVPDYMMKLAAEAAGGDVDQDGPTRGREVPDYIAQLAAEAASGEDMDGPTRGREISEHVARMAPHAMETHLPDSEDDISTRLRGDPEEDLSTRLRGDPEDGINTQLRGDVEDELSTRRALLAQPPRDPHTGDDEMRSLIAAADAHDEMQSLIAAADAYIEGQPAAPAAPEPSAHPARDRPIAADASSLRPSPIPKPPSRSLEPSARVGAGGELFELDAPPPPSHAQPTRPDPIELAGPSSHRGVHEEVGLGDHQPVDLNQHELEASAEERSGKAGWLVFMLLVIGAAAGGFFLRPVLSEAGLDPATTTAPVKAPAAPTALAVPGMLRGGKAGLGEADAALRKAEQERGRTPEVALARARFQLLRWLELGGSTADLGQAVSDAKESGVDPGTLAFAEVATALASNDPALVGVLTRIDGQPQRQSDAYYLLVAGIALEQRGSAESISRFRAAVGSEPGLHLAELSLVRSMLLYGNRTEAERRLKSLDPSGAHKDRIDALEALIWLHRKAESANAKSPLNTPPPTLASDADIPLSMTWVPAGLAYLAEEEETSRRGHLRRALEAIHTPSEATLVAKLAIGRGDGELALVAAKKATATWHTPEALRVLGHAAILNADLDALKVDSEDPIALELAAVSAYERGDMPELRKIAKQAGAPPGVRLRMERAFGLRALADSDYSTLRNPDTVGGELVALDALLDAGELGSAREIVDTWPKDVTHALRAHRIARLLRYEGETADAIDAIEKAGDVPPAIEQRVLIAAESPRRASKILEGFDPKKLSAGPFLNAYLVARAGSRQSAAVLLEREKPPGEDDPLSVHVAAALAQGQVRNTDAQEAIKKLLDAYPDNPDVRLAAQGVALELPKLSSHANKKDDTDDASGK